MEKNKRTLEASLLVLGLAKKAGKLVCGAPLVCKALSGKTPPALVIVSIYASDNTKKRMRDKCNYYGVRLYEYDAQTDRISAAIGGDAFVAACAICDKGLAGLFLSRAGDDIKRNEE